MSAILSVSTNGEFKHTDLKYQCFNTHFCAGRPCRGFSVGSFVRLLGACVPAVTLSGTTGTYPATGRDRQNKDASPSYSGVELFFFGLLRVCETHQWSTAGPRARQGTHTRTRSPWRGRGACSLRCSRHSD